MALRPVEYEADKGEFLTLDEVAAWVQDAMRAGGFGSEVVGARVSFGGKLQKIGIKVDTGNNRASLDISHAPKP